MSYVQSHGTWLATTGLGQTFARSALVGSLMIFVIITLDYLNHRRKRSRLGGVPVVGDIPYFSRRISTKPVDYLGIFQSGYKKYSKQSKPFAAWQQNDDFVIVLPPGAEEEIKNVGPDRLSFVHAVEDSHDFSLHTKILGGSHIDAIRLLVNKHMMDLHRMVVKQTDISVPAVFDSLAKDQEPFSGFLTLWHVTHLVGAAFMLGPEFAENKLFTDAAEYHCLKVPQFVHTYFWLPVPIRKLYWFLSPSGAGIRSSLKTMKREMRPAIREKVEAWRAGEDARKGSTLLGAMVEVKAESGLLKRNKSLVDKVEEDRQMDIFEDEVVASAFDSAGPVVCLVLQMLFETIEHSEITDLLRKEITTALQASGGEWTDKVMSSLPRLDSFTREVLRLDGPTFLSVTRSVRQPMQLKTAGNLKLNPGSIITSPAWLIHNDPDNYEKPNHFNPWRFYDEKTNSVTTRSTTTSNTFLPYGYGSGICPGRHMGIRWSQIMFAKLLMRYDVRFADGQKAKPANTVMPGPILPPYMAKIVFKFRESSREGS